MAGWVKIHRDIQKHWLWESEKFTMGQAWIDILMSTNFKPGRFRVKNGSFIHLKRGECGVSKAKFAERWGWSLGKVTRFLNTLQDDNMIDKRVDNNYTILLINNYELYQEETTNSTTTRELDDTTNESTNSKTNESTLKKEEKEKTEEEVPYQEIIEAWNISMRGKKQVRKLNEDRKKLIRARWNSKSQRKQIQYWKEFFDFLTESSFLMESGNSWFDFNWVFTKSNFEKILSHKYHKNAPIVETHVDDDPYWVDFNKGFDTGEYDMPMGANYKG